MNGMIRILDIKKKILKLFVRFALQSKLSNIFSGNRLHTLSCPRTSHWALRISFYRWVRYKKLYYHDTHLSKYNAIRRLTGTAVIG